MATPVGHAITRLCSSFAHHQSFISFRVPGIAGPRRASVDILKTYGIRDRNVTHKLAYLGKVLLSRLSLNAAANIERVRSHRENGVDDVIRGQTAGEHYRGI